MVTFLSKNVGDYASTIRNQLIDGEALLLIRDAAVAMQMGIKLGPALKLLDIIGKVRQRFNKA